MRIRRAIISPLVTLSFAGSVLAGVAVPAVTAVASGTPVAVAATVTPDTFAHA